MTTDDPTLPPDEPTRPLPPVPNLPRDVEPAPAAELVPPARPAALPGPGGPRLGHIVTGAILVLIGAGWLLEALDVVDVPWRFLLPSALIIVGVALVFGARTGAHGGLIAFGIVLTVLVLFAGVIQTLVDIPLSGGFGDRSLTPTVVEDEYRWGLGKMRLDLREAYDLAGEQIQASVVIGELIVIVPPDLPLLVTAQSGVGELIVLGEKNDGLMVDLECHGTAAGVTCGDGVAPSEPYLRLDLEVAIGKVEVKR
jgi:hypothetical protein